MIRRGIEGAPRPWRGATGVAAGMDGPEAMAGGDTGAGRLASAPLVPIPLVVDRLSAAIPDVEPETVPVGEAAGLILAAALRSSNPVPPRSVALRPGWAVDAAAIAGAGAYSPVVLSEPPAWVRPGEPLPLAADAILPADALTRSGGFAEIVASVPPGDGVRRAGEDAAAGAELCSAGARLSELHVGVALSAGLESCLVRRARVAVLSVGEGPVVDYLARFCEGEGASVSRFASAATDAAHALADLAGSDTHLLVLAGFDADEAGRMLSRAGGTVMGRLAARPGEGTFCALLAGRPVIVVPRRLAEALAAALLVLRPCLARAMRAPPRRPAPGRLARKLASGVGLTDIALVRAGPDGLEPLAVGDLTLTALARADAFVVIPPESEGFPAGVVVDAVPL